MKRIVYRSILALALTAAPVWAQSQSDHEAHHPAPPAPAEAQPGMDGMQMNKGMSDMPMMKMMKMMRAMPMDEMGACMGMGSMPSDHIEGRIAFLRAELKITDALAGAWSALADAFRANAQKLRDAHASMMHEKRTDAMQPPTVAQRLDAQEKLLAARLDGIRAVKAAYSDLEGVLSDEQKKSAEELLASPMGMGGMMGAGGMGMGMKGMMGERPPSDQMRPGGKREE